MQKVLALALLALVAGCTHIGTANNDHIDCITHQTNCPDDNGTVWHPANR
ncbi:MAG: hypothetical protein KGJ57_07920 [Sphingomonadales bacterium]|nr:hypothetical protein [Sphingomonadales bacterium]MDE2169340.1 hypothetical protein [Sphingomonadales bacterium]